MNTLSAEMVCHVITFIDNSRDFLAGAQVSRRFSAICILMTNWAISRFSQKIEHNLRNGASTYYTILPNLTLHGTYTHYASDGMRLSRSYYLFGQQVSKSDFKCKYGENRPIEWVRDIRDS